MIPHECFLGEDRFAVVTRITSDPDYPSSYLAMEGDTVTLSFTTDERVEDVEGI